MPVSINLIYVSPVAFPPMFSLSSLIIALLLLICATWTGYDLVHFRDLFSGENVPQISWFLIIFTEKVYI